MQIEPKPPTAEGPADWFTGDVFLDVIARGEERSRVRVMAVRFARRRAPCGTRTPSGRPCMSPRAGGLVQFRGGEISEIRSGDVITTSSGKWHWHGAGPEMDWASRSPTTSTTAGGRHERVHRHLRADPASRDSAVSRVIHGHERVRAPGRARIRRRGLPTLGSRPTSGTGLPQRRSDGDGRSPQWCGGIIRVGMTVGVEAGSGVVRGEPGQEGDAAA